MGLICGIVFLWRRVWIFSGFGGGAEALELVEGAIKRTLDAGFVTGKTFDVAVVVGEGAGERVEGRIGVVVAELRYADVEQAGFEGAETAQTPGGHGHLFDEQRFGGAGGLVFVEEGVAELAEFFGIFVREDGGLGGQAVAEGVVGDGGASVGGAGAGGKLGVAAVGVKLTFGNHTG